MSMIINPYRFGPAGAGLTGAFVNYYENNSNTSTYTYNSVAFGAEDPNRFIVILFQGIRPASTASRAVGSVTIGGVSASVAVQKDSPTSNKPFCAIAYAKVPAGLSGTVTVQMADSLALLYADIAVYRVVSGSGNLGVEATLSEVNGASDQTVLGSIATVDSGFVVAGSMQLNGGTATIAGSLSEDVENDTSSGEYFNAYSAEVGSGSINVAITTSDSGISAGEMVGVAASFRDY